VTPGATGVPVPASSSLKAEAEAILADLESNAKTMAEYLAFEVEQGEFFGILPPDSVRRLARAMDRVVFYLGQLVVSMGLELRGQIFEGGGIASERLWSALGYKRKSCAVVFSRVRVGDTRTLFSSVDSKCEGFGQNFGISRGAPVPEAPDQVVERQGPHPRSQQQ
jgi:hypothetical protein